MAELRPELLEAVLSSALGVRETKSDPLAVAERFWSDPVGWIAHCIRWPSGKELNEYQADIAGEVATKKRVAMYGPHGIGKTALFALIIWWFICTREAFARFHPHAAALGRETWKVPTTASGWRQLEKYLWPEINIWADRILWDRVGFELRKGKEILTMKVLSSCGKGEAFACASHRADLIEGAHGDQVLFCFDEGKLIQFKTFDSAEGALSGAMDGREAFALAGSTPGDPSGRFYDICRGARGLTNWAVRHVTDAEAIAARRMSPEWAEAMRELWGESDPRYLNKVKGEFSDAGSSRSAVPLSWVEMAVDRGYDWLHEVTPETDGRPWDLRWQAALPHAGPLRGGALDIGWGGQDRDPSVFARRYQVGGAPIIGPLEVWQPHDEADLVSRAVRAAAGVPFVVDVTRPDDDRVMRALQRHPSKPRPVPYVGSAKSERTDITGQYRFLNLRAELIWHVRELLMPSNDPKLILPEDQTLLAELPEAEWTVGTGDRIAIESKRDLRTRISQHADREDPGTSTNRADAVVMALWKEAARAAFGGIAARVVRSDGAPSIGMF